MVQNSGFCDLSGKVLVDQMIEHVYRIEQGKIKSMEIRGLEVREGEEDSRGD